MHEVGRTGEAPHEQPGELSQADAVGQHRLVDHRHRHGEHPGALASLDQRDPDPRFSVAGCGDRLAGAKGSARHRAGHLFLRQDRLAQIRAEQDRLQHHALEVGQIQVHLAAADGAGRGPQQARQLRPARRRRCASSAAA